MPKNTLTDAQNKYWYGYAQYHVYVQIEQSEERTAIREAFTAGARWAMRESSQLSPYIARFVEMMLLLGYFEDDGLANAGDATGEAEESDRAAGNPSEQT